MFKPLKKVRIFTIAKVVLIVSLIFLLITSLIIWKNYSTTITRPRGKNFQVALISPFTLTRTLPNTETRLWLSTLGQRAKSLQMNKTCAHYPNVLDLNYHNKHWQFLTTPNGIIYLYKAYYDTRKKNQIRILTMASNYTPSTRIFCQIWFHKSLEPEIIPAASILRANDTKPDKSIEMLLITCLVAWKDNSQTPSAVSLVLSKCENATNLLKIFYKPYGGQKTNLHICIEPLYFPTEDLSKRLIEWIEIQKIQGVTALTFYLIEIENRTEAVLSFYQNKGLINIVRLNFPKFNSQIDQKPDSDEIIELNRLVAHDCFYQSLYKYQYLLTMSIQETIILFKREIWQKFFEIWRSTVIQLIRNTYIAFKCIPLLIIDESTKSFSKNFTFLNATFVQDITGTDKDCSRSLLDTRRVIFFTERHPEVCFIKCEGFIAANTEASILRLGTNCLDPTSEWCDGLKKLPGMQRHNFILKNTNISANIQNTYCELPELFPNVTCEEKIIMANATDYLNI